MIVVFLFAFSLGGCSDSASSRDGIRDDTVVAVVNGEKILVGTFKKELKLMKQKYRVQNQGSSRPEELLLLKTKTLNQLVQTFLFEQEARKHNIHVSEEQLQQALSEAKSGYRKNSFKQIFELENIDPGDWKNKLKNNLLIKNLITTVVNSKVIVAENEVAEYFESHPKEFHKPEQVRALHIMVTTEEEARNILKRLETRGTRFSDLAIEYSQGPEGTQGGDLGYFEAGQMPEEFDGVFKLKPGKVSDIIRTPYGFHIFKMVDKKPERIMSFEESKKLIRAKLLQQRQEDVFRKWAKQIRDHARIEINHENFAQIN
ncbi:MAG: peptidyl-prolyl cis-trans isomerase [Nitrospinales bacterium]